MKTHLTNKGLLAFLVGLNSLQLVFGAESNPPQPSLLNPTVTNSQRRISWTPYPAAEQFKLFSTDTLLTPLLEQTNGSIAGYDWTGPLLGSNGFYRLQVTPMSSNALLSATVLNRLTYGPSPDDVERIKAINPQTFIDEQLAWDQIVEDIDTAPSVVNTPITVPPAPPLTNWIRVAATGTATSTNFFIYLSAAGKVYMDDVRLVAGTNADTGNNLLINGDFEDVPLTNAWTVASIYANSFITNSPTVDGLAASGTNCLLLVGSSGGTGSGLSLQQVYSPTNYPSGQKFTLSFSYLPVRQTASNITLTVRLSGGATASTIGLPNPPPTPPTPPAPPVAILPVYAKLTNAAPPLPGYSLPPTNISLSDLRAYHILHAVQSKRQLYEIMVQFFDNHFSTEYQKTKDWFDNNYSNSATNDATRQNLAVDLEWREHLKWRQALLNPDCNFYDLLKISVESPAMIIYLDTILSSRSAANENYAREILELHTLGADNGYIQADIVDLAKVWTGWSVAKKDASVANNPLAPAVLDPTNNPGLFVLHFRTNSHNYTSTKRLFTNNVVDPRFGPPYGGQSYSLILSNRLTGDGSAGMQEGYQVAAHLANLPYTAEFVSVKLCRTFVHENFEFNSYDYTLPNLSLEAKLVKDCMTAWDTPATDGRKGNIRKVLKTIFDSNLFRGHGASQQKVKTPLELSVSAVRALRLSTTDTNSWVSMTADTDGYGITSPLSRMGGMNLFAKPEPDGWSEFARIWLNTANLCERMRFAQHLLMPTTSSLKNTDYGTIRNVSDPVKLVKLKLPAAQWNDAAAVTDFFLGILYPGEGKANLDMDRTAAINFLNTTETGVASLFSSMGNTSTAYDGRVRGAVGLLMCFPRFQEQ